MTTGAQKLYVGNLTKQVHDFVYRVPDETKVRRQRIDVGTQILVGNQEGLPPAAVDMIIKHYSAFGLIDVADIDRTTSFAGLCYSLDKPLTDDVIRRGITHNDDVLSIQSEQQRQMFALAANQEHEQVAGDGLRAITFDVQEVGDDPKINESTRVTRNEQPRQRQSGRRGR